MSDQNESDRSERDDDAERADGEPERIGVPRELSDVDRRRVLGAIGGGGTVALAGCMGFFETEEEENPYAGNGDEDENGDEDDDDVDAFDIEFLVQEETIEVANDQDLLSAGQDEGWDLPYSCEVGSCGVCEAHVDGDGHELVEMTANDALSDDEVQEGAILTCTAQPRDDFAVDTDP